MKPSVIESLTPSFSYGANMNDGFKCALAVNRSSHLLSYSDAAEIAGYNFDRDVEVILPDGRVLSNVVTLEKLFPLQATCYQKSDLVGVFGEFKKLRSSEYSYFASFLEQKNSGMVVYMDKDALHNRRVVAKIKIIEASEAEHTASNIGNTASRRLMAMFRDSLAGRYRDVIHDARGSKDVDDLVYVRFNDNRILCSLLADILGAPGKPTPLVGFNMEKVSDGHFRPLVTFQGTETEYATSVIKEISNWDLFL